MGTNAYKFTGKERDPESGLDYFGARYHGSTLGRFSSPDFPFVDQNPANPQSWNLYTYVRNNPLKFIDPTGRRSTQPIDPKEGKIGGRKLGTPTVLPPNPAVGTNLTLLSVTLTVVNSENTQSTPTYDELGQVNPAAQQTLERTYGGNARSVYENWSPAERATFVNNVAAVVDAKFDLTNATLDKEKPFVTKGGQPYGINMVDVDGSKARMTKVGKSFRSLSNVLIGSLESSGLNGDVSFDVDLFNANSIFLPLHGLEVLFNKLFDKATDPWDAAAALRDRGVCSGVVPC